MKIRIFLLILAVCGMITGSAHSQGKILLFNGKEKHFLSAEVKGEIIVYVIKKTNKTITRKIDKYDVFSIVRDNGVEEIVYSPDTVSGEDATVGEVRDYIKGQRYADIIYHKPLNLISGIAVGGAGSVIGFYGLIVPVVYPAILGRFTPEVKTPITHNYNDTKGTFELVNSSDGISNITVNESFSAGYGKKARNLKIKNSLIGGGMGFAIGITALILVLGND